MVLEDSRVEFLGVGNSQEIIFPFLSSAKAHPNHEVYKCSQCGSGPYMIGCDSLGDNCEVLQQGIVKNVYDSDSCNECGASKDTYLVPVQNISDVQSSFLIDCRRKDFVGTGYRKHGELVAMAWGFLFPFNAKSDKSGDILYGEVVKSLEERGIDSRKVFYHHHFSSLPEFRQEDYGIKCVGKMLRSIDDGALTKVLFRTRNLEMVKCYENLARLDGGLEPILEDFNPKSFQKWFLLDLKGLVD